MSSKPITAGDVVQAPPRFEEDDAIASKWLWAALVVIAGGMTVAGVLGGAFDAAHTWTVVGTAGAGLVVGLAVFVILRRMGRQREETTNDEKKSRSTVKILVVALLLFVALLGAGAYFKWGPIESVDEFLMREWQSIAATCGGVTAFFLCIELIRRKAYPVLNPPLELGGEEVSDATIDVPTYQPSVKNPAKVVVVENDQSLMWLYQPWEKGTPLPGYTGEPRLVRLEPFAHIDEDLPPLRWTDSGLTPQEYAKAHS